MAGVSAGAAETVGSGAIVGALLPDGLLVHAPTRTAAPRMKMAMRDFKTCPPGLAGGLTYPTGAAGAVGATPPDEDVAAA